MDAEFQKQLWSLPTHKVLQDYNRISSSQETSFETR